MYIEQDYMCRLLMPCSGIKPYGICHVLCQFLNGFSFGFHVPNMWYEFKWIMKWHPVNGEGIKLLQSEMWSSRLDEGWVWRWISLHVSSCDSVFLSSSLQIPAPYQTLALTKWVQINKSTCLQGQMHLFINVFIRHRERGISLLSVCQPLFRSH